MSLFDIVKELQDTSSSKEKLAILKREVNNSLLKDFLEATLSPRIVFFMTEKTYPKTEVAGKKELDDLDIQALKLFVANRKVTGHAAKEWLINMIENFTQQSQTLIKYIVMKDFRAKVGETLVSKVWPEFTWTPPYQRCSTMREVDIDKWDWGRGHYSQLKADGMYVETNCDEDGHLTSLTRSGEQIDYRLLDEAFRWSLPQVIQQEEKLTGEFVVYENGEMCSRKKGNGILNSVLSGSKLPDNCRVIYKVWDIIEYKDGVKQDKIYDLRFSLLDARIRQATDDAVEMIETKIVFSKAEAMQHLKDVLARGLEGTVVKHSEAFWKDGTSPWAVKLKVEFDWDLKITGVYEGEQKYVGMLGGINLSSSCGRVVVNCGSGFDDKQRKNLWEIRDTLIGKIVAGKGNDIVDSETKDTLSIYLPIIEEIRSDKTEADDLGKLLNSLESVTGVKKDLQ